MRIRAKFRCGGVTPTFSDHRIVKLSAVYDPDIPEDQRFMKMTPSGSFEMTCDPAVADQFTPGKSYYLDLTEVPSS